MVISAEEINSFTNAIKLRYGIDFTNYEIKSLKRGIARLIARNGMKSMLDLWSRALKDKDFVYKCIDDLTVNLTELFRNPEVWSHLKDDFSKRFASQSSLTIWHAGCSTGKEIYSMAIVLKQAGLLEKTKTLASDLSLTALKTAQQGSYMSLLQKKYVESYARYSNLASITDYFDVSDSHITIKPEYKKHRYRHPSRTNRTRNDFSHWRADTRMVFS